MSDDIEEGLVSGRIINLIYKGDHYSYVIRTEYGHDLIVDDEYLWNMDDTVSLVMPGGQDEVPVKEVAGKKVLWILVIKSYLKIIKRINNMGGVFSRKQLGIPYGILLILFVAAPLLVLFYYAFTNGSGQFTLGNLSGFFTDPNTLGTLVYMPCVSSRCNYSMSFSGLPCGNTYLHRVTLKESQLYLCFLFFQCGLTLH